MLFWNLFFQAAAFIVAVTALGAILSAWATAKHRARAE